MKSAQIRPPAVANAFYPGNEDMLKRQILEYLGKADKKNFDGKLKAIISPHAGYIYSGPIAAYAYKLLKDLDQTVEWKILLLGPSHHLPFSGAVAPVFEKWQTPLGLVDIGDIRDVIGEKDSIVEVPNADLEEHSLEVQVPFLQIVLKNFVLYPLVLGSLNGGRLAEDIKGFCEREDVIVIASSDLSHYHSYNEAKKIDFATCEAVCNIDIEKMSNEGDACGKSGILTLMYLAKIFDWKCKILDYRNSGDTAGNKDQVVGYGAWVFYK